MANAYAPNYTELVLELQDICENTDSEFVSNCPRFIQRGQDAVQRDLGLDIWNSSELNTLSSATYPRNADWLIVHSLYLPDSNTFLTKRHIDYIRQYGGSAGTPKVWCEDGETLLRVAPEPSASLSIRVSFYARLAALSATNLTNWISDNAADLLLLQALINAFTYEVAPERATMMAELYKAVLPSAVIELRDSERRRDQPMRAAPRPAVQAGASA